MAAATPLYPALWTASSLGQTEEVRRLLANDADIEERGGPTECSPLAVAVSSPGREQLVGLLLHHGAEVSSRDNTGSTPLHSAASEGHEALSLVLLHHGADVSAKADDGAIPLHNAAFRGNEVVSLSLIEHGADLSATTNRGWTALHIAARFGCWAAARLLLDQAALNPKP